MIGAALIVIHVSCAVAHEARPAYLELTETVPDRYDVVWRTPVSAGQRLPVVLQWPEGVSVVVEPRLREFADSVVERQIITAPTGLSGNFGRADELPRSQSCRNATSGSVRPAFRAGM